ncbi:glucosaminidase domain-containing protein [Hyphomicrobium sp. D-2]|uniref:glucosaminidase domain-containing protein n=1 Tax=Hyphomicrobium sp. D-2 TaxID=3041621 RepID=UPI002458AFC0|nr:glucosaminidase domain-containing protein [Hyphomicrobium sp. D-2]MDH4980816.1 glucosaminidase domain-containing protein [Hyphomicrobium sp. D-2]
MAGSIAAAEAAPPRIRTDAGNVVPRCVTPQRLMAFLKTRNTNLNPRFGNIAEFYKKHGQAWNVRWDYAFFQMALETNFLTYRQGNGKWGDVNPKQNNFAGLGTTGGGVPGDSYPDVNTGVLAQIQHLVVYSGERIASPVGERTRLKQDHILAASAPKNRRMTFADLARRWAADRNYGRSIEWVANSFREQYCSGRNNAADAEPTDRKAMEVARANLGGPPVESRPTAPPASPVRTVWQASPRPGPVAARASVSAPPAAVSFARAGAAPSAPAPAPERKPARIADVAPAETTASYSTVAEQMIQTGAGQPMQLALADLDAVAASNVAIASNTSEHTRSAPSPHNSRPLAFAYAGAMGRMLGGTQASSAQADAQAAQQQSGCQIANASYGGQKAFLIRSGTAPDVRYTVLNVLAGFEKSMLENYLKASAPDGESIGEFANRNDAMTKARELCPGAPAAPVRSATRTG